MLSDDDTVRDSDPKGIPVEPEIQPSPCVQYAERPDLVISVAAQDEVQKESIVRLSIDPDQRADPILLHLTHAMVHVVSLSLNDVIAAAISHDSCCMQRTFQYWAFLCLLNV